MSRAALACAFIAALGVSAFAKGKANMHWNGQHCGVQSPEHRVIQTADDWQALWKDLGKAAPSADFSKQFAVAVFVGPKPTGGYKIEWSEPKKEGARLVVRFEVKAPTGMVTQAFTQPWDVRLFPRPAEAGEIVVEGRP